MGFHVDSSGNIWSGDNVGNTFSSANPEFYVSASGLLHSEAGDIGGITIDTGGLEANYSDINDTGFKITSGGDAFFNSVDLRVPSGASDPPSDGTEFLSIGSGKIYEFNSNLILDASGTGNDVVVKTGDRFRLSGVGSDPTMLFDGAQGNVELDLDQVTDSTTSSGRSYTSEALGYVNELTFKNQDVDIFRINAQNSDVYFYGQVEIAGDFIPNNLKAYNGFGSSGQTLQRTSNGLEWVNASGSHADSDHSSFANSSHGHDISEINNHSHSGLASQSSVTSLSNSLTSHTGHGYMSFTLAASSGGSSTISNGNTLGIYAGSRISTVQSGDSITISSSALGSISQSGSDGFVTSVSGSTVTTSSTKSGTIFTDTYAPISSGGDVGFSFRGVDVYYTSLNSVSDETTKTGIADLTYGLDWINTLRPISYRYDTRTVYVCENDLTDYEYYNSDDTCEHCVNQNLINNFQYQQDLKDFNEGEIETEPTEPTELTTGLVSKEILWGNSKENWGFSAQEIEATLPTDPDLEIVEDDAKPDGSTLKVLDYIQMIAPLVKAVQELSTQISDLTARVEVLEG